jgi:oligopeptide/dipeptide ABC transporter ATP-binding protein
MYLGKIVELADGREIFKNPVHPYTKALISAIPLPIVGAKTDRIILEGDVPSPVNPPDGCRFAGRCRFAADRCWRENPDLADMGGEYRTHFAACFNI